MYEPAFVAQCFGFLRVIAVRDTTQHNTTQMEQNVLAVVQVLFEVQGAGIMLCCVVLCCVLCVMSCYVMLYCVVLCCVVLC